MKISPLLATFILLTLASLACSIPATSGGPTPGLSAVPETLAQPPSETPVPATETPIPSQTPQPSLTPTATEAASPTPVPTYAILRGKTTAEKTTCRYGPGPDYLYFYGLNQGATQEVIGRNQAGTWVLTRARGAVNRCWIRTSLLELNGDVMSVEPVDPHIVLGWSPYYGPLTGVSATRNGNEVTVFWHALILRAGDDSLQTPYILEAWVCQGGQMIFQPVGTYALAAKVLDEPGCSEPSRGRVIAAEKHGYTIPVEVAWPQP